MSQQEMMSNPPFRSMVRASGLGEVWTHTHDESKFTQFGWRSTTKECSYNQPTLIGNWNEDKFDIERQKKSKRLPSQFEHYFEPTYDVSYNKKPVHVVPESLKHQKARHPHAHPSHQPELDDPSLKAIYNSWETTTRAAYIDPRVKTAPINNGSTQLESHGQLYTGESQSNTRQNAQ
ncbi:unnamed protein product [Owenia fusiformis]|uniref:Uncharacterized protein n=1 Tax=Owenia fusiformis TaxID=6347 RepID=A0A8J1TYI2_OWEFU|nr:unnamed protein product [Owenia fusiformis]